MSRFKTPLSPYEMDNIAAIVIAAVIMLVSIFFSAPAIWYYATHQHYNHAIDHRIDSANNKNLERSLSSEPAP